MTREEYYAAIQAYKEGKSLQHRMMDANSEDTSSKALDNWKKQYFNQAVALKAKYNLAKLAGRNDDANTYEKQLNIIMDRLTNISGVSLSAKQALAKEVDTAGTQKANVQIAKHSDESDEVLEHGGEWKKHKYIRIENGRYIYPEDLESKKLREDAAKQQNVSKGMQERAAFDKNLLNNGKNSDGSPVKKDKELSKELQKDYDQSKAWSAAAQAQEKGMLRKAEELKAQADKKRFDATAANTAKVNEERKEKAVNNNNQSVQTARSQSDESAAKAQKEGEAMQAWKNVQNAKAAAAEVRKGSDSARKAQAEGELQQLWKDYNNTEKINSSIDDAIEKFSNKFDIAANYKTKDVIGNNLSKEKYNAFMKPAVTYYLNSLHGMTDFKKAESNGKIPDANEFIRSLDKMTDDPKALYRKLLNDAGRIAMDIAEEYKFSELAKATKVKHSFDLSTKEGYYAAIAEYLKKYYKR